MSDSTSQATIPDQNDYQGQADNYQAGNLFNALDKMIRLVVAGKAFCAIVKVLSVSGGGVHAPPRVSVQPMVNQIDGNNNQIPHGEIFDIPVFRLRGGNAAVFIDPEVGDIGVAVVCDRDISNVKATGAISGPGSFRQNDYADGCYFGGFLGEVVDNYIWIKGNNDIEIVSLGTVSIFSAALRHNDINVGFDHEHTLVQTGGDLSGPPQP